VKYQKGDKYFAFKTENQIKKDEEAAKKKAAEEAAKKKAAEEAAKKKAAEEAAKKKAAEEAAKKKAAEEAAKKKAAEEAAKKKKAAEEAAKKKAAKEAAKKKAAEEAAKKKAAEEAAKKKAAEEQKKRNAEEERKRKAAAAFQASKRKVVKWIMAENNVAECQQVSPQHKPNIFFDRNYDKLRFVPSCGRGSRSGSSFPHTFPDNSEGTCKNAAEVKCKNFLVGASLTGKDPSGAGKWCKYSKGHRYIIFRKQ
jgi:DNA polymerase III gamma/tau subunit